MSLSTDALIMIFKKSIIIMLWYHLYELFRKLYMRKQGIAHYDLPATFTGISYMAIIVPFNMLVGFNLNPSEIYLPEIYHNIFW